MGVELGGRPELVAVARHEQARHVEVAEVVDPKVLGLLRRVQRIADQYQAGRWEPAGHGQRAHPAPHTATAQHQPRRVDPPVGRHSGHAVVHRPDQYRSPVGERLSCLPVREVHALHRQGGQTFLKGHQARMVAVATRPGGEEQAGNGRRGGHRRRVAPAVRLTGPIGAGEPTVGILPTWSPALRTTHLDTPR